MDDLHRQLKRGTLELLLLSSLEARPGHGYELIRRLRDTSGGQMEVKEGTVYPVLYRLQDAGYIVADWQPPERGVPRKVYRITEPGRARSAQLEQLWRGFTAAVNQVLEHNRGLETPAESSAAASTQGQEPRSQES